MPIYCDNPDTVVVWFDDERLTHTLAHCAVVPREQTFGAPLCYDTPEERDKNYYRVGLVIAAYEGSSEINSFISNTITTWKAWPN